MTDIPGRPGPADLRLTVTSDHVELRGAGSPVRAGHGHGRLALDNAVDDVRRARPDRRSGAGMTMTELLDRRSRLLGDVFLPGPVRDELERRLDAAAAADQPIRLGLAVAPGLATLPWEALPGPDGSPLALCELVNMYRESDAAAIRTQPGPLRIVVAIAAPEGDGDSLYYERELLKVDAAVRQARHGGAADVRVVEFATLAAIRDELDRVRPMCCTSPGTGHRASCSWSTRTAARGS